MSTARPDPDSQAADAAINRVLAAERDAQDEVAECRRQALAILREARARTRALRERADRRIARAHAIADATTEAALGRLAAEADALARDPEPGTEDLARLDGAIARLLDEILAP